MSNKTVFDLLCSRRTIHDFEPNRLPPYPLIEQAITAACWAPNHHLTEPWHFHWLGTQTRQGVIDLNAKLVTAQKGPQAGEQKRARWQQIPGWLMVSCERHDDPLMDQENYAACCCAIQNFCLYLWSHGVGVKWTTGPVTRHEEFFDLLWLDPQQQRVVGLLWYGYPAQIPVGQRSPVAQMVTQLP